MHTQSQSIKPSFYEISSNRFDEMFDAKNDIRPHWQSFQHNLQQIGLPEFENRYVELKRLLRENGVTYNIYGDPSGINRPWKLDPIPYQINQKEWATIEEGLKQRAHLLNLILTDLYGKKDLLKKGILPLELIYNHNGFVRQADGITLKNKMPLTLYGADIVRNSKGGFWVISDRTQAPSGLGYSLENRSIMSRVMPDFFRDAQVRKLSGFTNMYRSAIAEIAAYKSDNPKVVLLTPGPHNETYFEQAYVAAFMGYTLAQGADMVVRDNQVWLKSINGLEKIDVIVRRIDDLFCDPLELREDSRLGIPGLMEVVRKGNVTIANPIGSAVLENPGLMAFMPSICKYYLNEKLILPSIATWWCGQKSEMDYVLENLQKIKIKTIYRQDGNSTLSEGNLSAKELEIVKQKILSKPYLYVGQEIVEVASTPSFTHGTLEPRFASFRNFLVAHRGMYHCMAGGLTRSSDNKDIFKVSNQLGGYSKDTWILGTEPAIQLSVPYTSITKTALVQQNNLSSRAAENLFWAGRYIERTKSTSRFLNVVLDQLNQGNKSVVDAEKIFIENLLQSLTNLTMTYPGFLDEKKGEALLANPFQELMRIVFDNNDTGSLASTITGLRRSIYAIRDKFSLYTWRAVYKIEQEWSDLEQSPQKNFRSVSHALDNLVIYISAFLEMNMESSTQEHSFLLLDIGRRIEKAMLITSLLRSTLTYKNEEAVEYRLMESVLITCASLNTYRARYRTQLAFLPVIDLLVLDTSNPASLAFQIDLIKKDIQQLPNVSKIHALSNEHKSIFEAYSLLQLCDTASLAIHTENTGVREELNTLLSKISTILQTLSTQISSKYFSHLHANQQSFNEATETEEI